MPPAGRETDEKAGRGVGEPSLAGTYVQVIVLEVVIIVLLWVFGRMYS